MKRILLLFAFSFILFIGNIKSINVFEIDSVSVPTAVDTVEVPTMITEKYIENLKISPNPVNDYFYINIPNKYSMNIDIYDLNGVKKKTLSGYSNNKVDISDLPKGVYIMSIIFDDKFILKQKIIKN
jgi:molybdopterin-binding protein